MGIMGNPGSPQHKVGKPRDNAVYYLPTRIRDFPEKKRFGWKVLTCHKAGCEPPKLHTSEPLPIYGSESDMPVDSGAPFAEVGVGNRR
jgi:hypothetical protein